MRQRRYAQADLLGEDTDSRIQAIETLSAHVHWIPHTRFYWESHTLIQEQVTIQQVRWKPKKEHLLTLASALDEDLPLVHGDLCRKNVIFDGTQLWVVDWEPSLFQYRKGVPCFMVTEPYWAYEDRTAQRITHASDALAFFFTSFRIIHGYNPLRNHKTWIQVRRERPISMTPIPEMELCRMTFTELLGLVEESASWVPRLVYGIEK
jgi:hypothetical protein